MNFFARNRASKTNCSFYQIEWTFFRNKLAREQETERSRSDTPLCPEALSMWSYCRGSRGESAVINAMRRRCELVGGDSATYIEPPISFPYVQETVGPTQKLV
jgi:hypothetical protein